jgi:pullulanase
VTVNFLENGTILYNLKDDKTELLVIFKNNDDREIIPLDGKFTMIYDGKERSRRILSKVELDDISTYILKRK